MKVGDSVRHFSTGMGGRILCGPGYTASFRDVLWKVRFRVGESEHENWYVLECELKSL